MSKLKSVIPMGLAAIAAHLLALPSGAQQLPTPEQAQRALQSPSVAAAVRARIGSSGLTSDQIRARLRAAGYPDTLLDSYMPGAADANPGAPSDDVMRAVRYLGLVDSQEQDSLSRLRGDGELLAGQTGVPRPGTLSPYQAATSPAPGTTAGTIGFTALAAPSRIYGLDVFRRGTSQFEPDLAGPVDASYKLGPRDVIALILTGGVENSYSLEVTREGFIVIPQVGQIYVANLTLEQLTDVLYRRLRSVYSGLGRGAEASTKLFVTVARLRSNQVFVVGDVTTPGSYQVSSAGTMLTALYAAGGPTDNGGLRSVQLRRGGKVVGELDIYSYLSRGDATKDVRLETGDVVFVPVHGPRVEITGEVVRPAIYELSAGETLDDLMHLAGGFKADASRRRVLVRRIVPPQQRTSGGRDRTVLDVTSEALALNGAGGGTRFPLEDGDQVQVFGIANKVRNRISVQGAVWQPGNQGYQDGMKLSDALRLAGGVRPEVKGVQISRLAFDESRSELRAAFRDTLGTLVNDLTLQEDDSITVFGVSDFRPDRYVVVTGAVRKPGRYPYREGMTLRDVLHYSGGLDDGAYLDHAEIARVPANRTNGALAVTLDVTLDSTYLLERGLDGKYSGPAGLPARASGAPEVTLQAYDNVLILQQPDWQLERTVTLIGELTFPGNYVLRSKSERVSDVIRRAGGLTSVAYPAGAVFTRPDRKVGRIGFDLEHVMRDTSYRDNIVMLAGDTLYVPPQRFVVDVRGAVHSPIAVAYRPGKNIDYYIDAAGGLTYNADKKRAYVQQPSGVVEPYKQRSFMIPDGRPDPLPGAVVVVPAKDPNDKKDWTAIVGATAQVLASMVAILAIATR
ncbi:MAG TPA: SLBB domain-containing protein [Gemmatimonadaceae bacterium]|nr:SLBB domain-containing protein [Gemmatimonadaceae bacterium]